MHPVFPPGQDRVHSEAFLRSLMRRQLRLSLVCAAAFLSVLLVLPLLNYWLPDLMAKRVAGFTLTWFVLGIGFFPAVWVIAFWFIRRSMQLEREEVEEIRGQANPGNQTRS